MKLARVQRVMTRRLAWLTAKAIEAPTNGAVADERDALHTLMRCQGMLDVEQLARKVVVCEAKVLPAEQRTIARARRGDELVGLVQGLIDGIRQAARVA